MALVGSLRGCIRGSVTDYSFWGRGADNSYHVVHCNKLRPDICKTEMRKGKRGKDLKFNPADYNYMDSLPMVLVSGLHY